MLRPERMSRVSVTGAKQVMPDVIETIHDLDLVHLSDYDGEWSGFDPGDPVEGAEPASEKLVTVRALLSTLDVSEDDAGPARIVTPEALEEQLEAVRTAVNELDDRRAELRDEVRAVEDRAETVEPFVDLGLDLELLSGYDSLDVAVGEGDADAVREAVATADGVRAYGVFGGGGVVAAFVQPSAGADPLEDALVGVDFTAIEVPDGEGDPAAKLAELESERERIEAKLETVESELEDLRVEHAGFLLAAEETLSIEVEKNEAPLAFATTERAFVAEGWVPTDSYVDLVEALREAVADRVTVEELERATYTPSHGHETEAVADGGVHADDGPPVVQDNPGPAKPFQVLVEVINRPRYTELDPTVVLFLTFPFLFGFMIGDLGYGVLYVAMGWWLIGNVDSDALGSLGGVAVWAGAFTAIFGVLYGEIFGFHLITEHVWVGALGMHGPPLHKGLLASEYAELWLTLSLVAGALHLATGYVFGFVNDRAYHGLKEAVYEDLGPLALMLGTVIWLFSRHVMGPKPAFMFEVLNGDPIALGFAGFPETVGLAALGLAAVGFVLVVVGEGAVGFFETPTYALVNVLSYTRLAAVLLAKAGMAFVVNLLVFGAYEHHGETHFALDGHFPEGATTVFGGLVHAGAGGLLAGLAVLLIGHTLVLALGITSAGLQAVRLEYVEFMMTKFYEGGGEAYDPFGRERVFTTEE